MRIILPLLVGVLVSGCVDRTGITVSGRDVADDGSLETETKEIARKYSSVVAGMKEGRDACLNTIVEKKVNTFENGTQKSTVKRARYSALSGENSQMFVMHLNEEIEIGGGAFGPAQEILTVRAWPDGENTFVSLDGGNETFRSLDVGILRMANGDSLICPRMPFEY